MSEPISAALQTAAGLLSPRRDELAEAWFQALRAVAPGPEDEIRSFCRRTLEALLSRLSRGELEELLRDEAAAAETAARAGASFHPLALAIRVLDRCCLPFLLSACPDGATLAQALLALDELGDRRLEILLKAQEDEGQRRLADAQDQAARSAERARELERLNEAMRKAQAESQHRADQIALLSSVAHRINRILDPEQLLLDAAELIRTRLNHMYVAVVVLDNEGVLVGRWAGRPGVFRRSAGRTQGPAAGVIGRAIRKRAPQVVPDVAADPDYHQDVPEVRSEMVVPLMDEGEVIGAMDFQSDRPAAFGLDDVAAGEALADFLVVSLRNARLFASRSGA
jgi:putative methionine-R-sulfoxide reductase with GAF domain